MQKGTIHDYLFTDDYAGTQPDMQENMDMFSAACEEFCCINPLLLDPTQNPPSQLVAKNFLLWLISSPNLAALCQEQLPLMKRSPTELHVQA